MTIELRKRDKRWSLPVYDRGDSIVLSAKAMGSTIRPESESVAEVYVGILGTCEGLSLPETNNRNRMNPGEQRPGSQPAFPGLLRSKQRKESGYRRSSSRQERREGATGCLSRLIVAFENRETFSGGACE